MDLQSLITVGLTPLQAEAYALLIETGGIKPPDASRRLKATRTNTYKLLDKLVELGLAQKVEDTKKIIYVPNNPLALANLTAAYRAEAVAREEAASKVMQQLLAQYYTHSDRPDVKVVTGRKKVAEAYRQQLVLREDIYFIHSKADVPMMGFDVMHEIRTIPSRHDKQRNVIMAADGKSTINYEQHKRSNLSITWAEESAYTAPVEWSVTESSLLIVLYATEPHAILLADRVVAGAFLQLWKLLSNLLKQQDLHKQLHQN